LWKKKTSELHDRFKCVFLTVPLGGRSVRCKWKTSKSLFRACQSENNRLNRYDTWTAVARGVHLMCIKYVSKFRDRVQFALACVMCSRGVLWHRSKCEISRRVNRTAGGGGKKTTKNKLINTRTNRALLQRNGENDIGLLVATIKCHVDGSDFWICRYDVKVRCRRARPEWVKSVSEWNHTTLCPAVRVRIYHIHHVRHWYYCRRRRRRYVLAGRVQIGPTATRARDL